MDPMLIILGVVLVGFIFLQVRNSRKRSAEAEERTRSLIPGVEVMTNFGLYGTLISIDEDENLAFVEIAPGTTVKLHRQVILKAVEEELPVVDEGSDGQDRA